VAHELLLGLPLCKPSGGPLFRLVFEIAVHRTSVLRFQGLFRNLRFFTPELIARYGNATTAQAFLALSQAAAYESHRAMFEGASLVFTAGLALLTPIESMCVD
jgi:hypothetical protein